MSSAKNILQVFEHHTLKVDEASAFKMVHFNALEKYGYKTKEKFFSVGNKRIKFNNYVGVIQVKNLTIEILPLKSAVSLPVTESAPLIVVVPNEVLPDTVRVVKL